MQGTQNKFANKKTGIERVKKIFWWNTE